MKKFTLFTRLIFSVVILLPTNVWPNDLPIVLKVSDQKTPPLHAGDYDLIGFWDVDDRHGNRSRLESYLGGETCSRGTYELSKDGAKTGCYMASLGISRGDLHKISDLRIVASNNSPFKILNKYPNFDSSNNSEKKVLYTNSNETSYLVGVWDVDGGGGRGADDSSGSYGMQLLAKLRKSPEERKLLDLKLIASNKKSPKILNGYDLIGYWDVDKGGSQGTDGSRGSYMLTLLAKWD